MMWLQFRLLFHISKEHQITTALREPCRDRGTVSHFKRASNHNRPRVSSAWRRLFHISKEHQITTRSCTPRPPSKLFHISKEHQITTPGLVEGVGGDCFTFQKSIKSQRAAHQCRATGTVSHFKRASNHNSYSFHLNINVLFHISKEHQITTTRLSQCQSPKLFHISKEHQITTHRLPPTPAANCFTFQKSIKSQLRVNWRQRLVTVSHFKRASNHNEHPSPSCDFSLFHISKEHQITTTSWSLMSTSNCFTFQKSIKSQLYRLYRHQRRTVSHFKRASNHNWCNVWGISLGTVSHFKRASNHN